MTINKCLNIDLNILSPQKHIRIHEGDVDSVDILIGVSVDDESVDLDGVTIKYDATINNYLAEQDADGSVVDGKISIPVTQNMAAMSGLLLIDVRMIQSDQILFTQTICATVEKAVVNGSTYIDFDKVTIIQRMNALEEKMDYVEELVENFDTSKLIVSTNRPPSGAPASVDVDLLRVGDTWILSGANIVYKLVEAQYNYQPVPSVEPYHKFTWQSLNTRLFNGTIAPPTEEQSVTVEYTIGDTTFTWTAIQFFSFGDMYRQSAENYFKYFECVYSAYGRYTWCETDSYTIEEINTKLDEKENTANKTSAITAANKASTTQYTTPKAVADYTGAMLGSDCVTPQMYGAKANGTANDTAAINAAIAAADTVWFPQGVYLIDGCPASASSTQVGITVPSGKTLVFHKNAVLLKKQTLIKEDVLRLAPGAENVRIFGGVIRGDRSYKLKNLSAEQFHAYNGGSTGILMCGCKNVIVENTRVEDICGDGVALVYDEDGNCCEDITIRRCTVNRSWRNGICVGRALRVFIERCHITDSGCAEDDDGLAIVRDELAYDANLISRSIITEGDGTLHGCLPRCGIDIESEARYSGEPLFSNENVYIRDSVFIGNDGDDIIMTNPCDHIYISGNRCEKRITSARNTPTDEIVISNSSLKDVNLHGERLVNCTVTGVVYAFKTGSRFENCDINSLEINASTDEEHTHYLSHCTIRNIGSYGADKSTVLFQGCTFLFSADAQTAFGGKKMVLNNCDVIFDALYNPASTPLNVLRDFQAVNTTFKMLDSDNAHTLESFFKANSSGGSVTLEGCVLDLWPKVKNILNANIGAATVVNCAVINHNSVGALEGSGYIIHGNVYKNNPLVIPTKTSDLENDSGFLTQHQDISGKVDKVEGKGLSTNDYTTAEKNKLGGIETGATKTVIDSALSSTSTNPVQNKVIQKALNDLPAVPTKVSELTNDSGYLTLGTLPVYNGGVQ